MDKKGYSTFDAIQLIEEWFGIEECASAGLKDSDGVTSQKISVPIRYQDMTDRLEAFNRETRTDKSFIHLSFLGYASESLKVDPTLLANYGINTPLLGAMPLGF